MDRKVEDLSDDELETYLILFGIGIWDSEAYYNRIGAKKHVRSERNFSIATLETSNDEGLFAFKELVDWFPTKRAAMERALRAVLNNEPRRFEE